MKNAAQFFDEIGLAYARNYEEVEAARNHFDLRRTSVLETLNSVLAKGLPAAHAPVYGRKDGGWERRYLAGSYDKARHKAGWKDAAQGGVFYGLDHDEDFAAFGGARFGFGCYVMFSCEPPYAPAVRVAVEGVAKESGAVIDYIARAIYLRTAWIRPDEPNFTLAAFEDHVARLPTIFAAADPLAATAYLAARGL